MRPCLLMIGALILALAAGCAGTVLSPVVPPFGSGYNNTGAPVNLQFRQSELGTRVGRAGTMSILGLISSGDCSVAAAARRGGITTIKHIDADFLNVLGIYGEYTTVVYGD